MAARQWTREEVARGAGCLVVIDDVVYEVTRYLAAHPGGAEVLEQVAGADASQQFHDLGHSTDARAAMRQYAVGELVAHERAAAARGARAQHGGGAEGGAWARWMGPVIVLLATLYMFLLR